MSARSPSHPPPAGLNAYKAWLDPLGWGNAELRFLAGDASYRTYYRAQKGHESRILMVAPPEHEKPAEYVEMTKLLQGFRLSVPTIHHADVDQGLILLEDFGDQVYSKCLREGQDEEGLYTTAVDTLIHLHQQQTDSACLPPYDQERFLEEACIFLEWAYPEITGHPAPATKHDEFIKVWSKAYQARPSLPQSVVLRDFMVDNLMLLDNRTGIQSCGLLDFQDALWGDTTYDLVSLLEDARRDVSPTLAKRMIDRYLEAFPPIQRDTFDQSYFTWGAQRSTKILGIFTRLAIRDNKPHYLNHLPRVWKILKAGLQHPALHTVHRWFDDNTDWGGS